MAVAFTGCYSPVSYKMGYPTAIKSVIADMEDSMCALKITSGNGGAGQDWRAWWDWVEDVWPVTVGLVTWEFEDYSSCCFRGE
jgi:hypothetical protein